MRIVCTPPGHNFAANDADLEVVLYGRSDRPTRGSVGGSVLAEIVRRNLAPTPRAWDLLSLALAVVTADLAGHRGASPDGWTREFELEVAVSDRAFWSQHAPLVAQLLSFLTTDRWHVDFIEGGMLPKLERPSATPIEDSVVLLSGGLDSFVGAIDLVARGQQPFAVSQLVRGDAQNQTFFASAIGKGLPHLQLNHNAKVPNPEEPPSQRSRSVIFLAYGVLIATALRRYNERHDVTLYVCENGFISINPPLTDARLGSLSTRTTHPVFLALFQKLLDAAGLRVRIENPYQLMTKGQMLAGCQNQRFLKTHAHSTTSCGRYKRFGYRHCGRCVPCLIRRSAFYAWPAADATDYVYSDLASHEGQPDFDDLRSAAMAIALAADDGMNSWLGATLSSSLLPDVQPYKDVARRGLEELGAFLAANSIP
jgi:7-cyano-7-deazaguanine synthase in queuosine biosynthesis